LNERRSVNPARIAMKLGADFWGESQLPFALPFTSFWEKN
jgi:hypothetical protein